MVEILKRLFRHNILLKLAAFFLAVILWAYVMGDSVWTTETREIERVYPNVALEWLNLSEEMTIMQMPEAVQVVLSGRSDILDSITPQMLRVFIDLRDLGPGKHRLTPMAEVPKGVKVLSFEPQQVVVELEKILSPQMPVDVDIMGLPADGYLLGEPKVTPDSVFVRGTRSQLENVSRIRTIINVDGAEQNLTQIVPAHAIDALGQLVEGVQVSPALVEVFIPVSQPQKEVPVRVSLKGVPAEGYEVEQILVHPAHVTIEGAKHDLQNVEEIFTLPVDITDLDENIVTTVNLAEPPRGVEIQEVNQVQVEIIVAKK